MVKCCRQASSTTAATMTVPVMTRLAGSEAPTCTGGQVREAARNSQHAERHDK